MSNRQLIIVGSFALACCVILAVAFRHHPAPDLPKPDEPSTVGRYQVVSVPHQGDNPQVVVLDTATGQTWHVVLSTETKDVEKWKDLGSPAFMKLLLPATAVSAL
jgi:hypothetical protein